MMSNVKFAAERPSSSSEASLDDQSRSSHESWKQLLHDDKRRDLRLSSVRGFYKQRCFRVLAFLLILGVIATLIWLWLALSLPKCNRPKAPLNRVNSLMDEWKSPEDSVHLLSPWNTEFTRGITPLPCHSHNDYWRSVPLYEALAAGCTGVEADIYLPTKAGSNGLPVGHNSRSLTPNRTLQSLYTGPLLTILDNLNKKTSNSDRKLGDWNSIFQSSANTTLTLLLDFKSTGSELWPYVIGELEGLRSKGWLTHWTNSIGITWAPIIVVATGNAPFDLLISNTTYRDVFYDAPLDDIANPIYDNTNSYYASASMSRTLGRQWLWKFSSKQLKKITAQTSAASSKGLKARYWSTPAWPVTFKDYVSGILVENGIGMLNVDDFSRTLYFPLATRFVQNRLGL